MKIALTGADGQLGTDIGMALKAAGHEAYCLTIEHMDIGERDSVYKALDGIKPALVINTAAYHHVEKCEENPELAFKVNGLGARNLAEVCNGLDAALMHISTDYVFDGKKKAPYVETDRPVPLNVYANTKLSGEHFVEAIAKKWYILRVSGIYGKAPCIMKGGRNFVETMIKLSSERPEVRVVDNERLTPTSTLEVARQIVKMLEAGAEYGLYHCTAEGECSWYEFAAAIFDVTKPSIHFSKANPGEFAVKVNRPEYSVLENSFLKTQGINIMSHWRKGLEEYLQNR